MILVGIPNLWGGDRFATYLPELMIRLANQTSKISRQYYITPEVPRVKTAPERRRAYTDQLNRLIATALSYDSTHLWIVDSDVQPPSNALEKLLDHNVDLASGVYCFHNERNLAMFGTMRDDPFKMKPKDLNYVTKPVIGDHEKVGGGSGCMLISRRLLESGIFFESVDGRGPDLYYWHRVQESPIYNTCRIDFTIKCGHLPEHPLDVYEQL